MCKFNFPHFAYRSWKREAQPHLYWMNIMRLCSVCLCQGNSCWMKGIREAVTWTLAAAFPLKSHLCSCWGSCTHRRVHENNEPLHEKAWAEKQARNMQPLTPTLMPICIVCKGSIITHIHEKQKLTDQVSMDWITSASEWLFCLNHPFLHKWPHVAIKEITVMLLKGFIVHSGNANVNIRILNISVFRG